MKISFSNFPQDLNEPDIEKIFSEFGTVNKLTMKRDKLTKKFLGFGTIEMEDNPGKKAVSELNGKTLQEKVLSVGDFDELQAKLQSGKQGSTANNPGSAGKVFGRSSGTGGSGAGVLRRGGNRGT